VPDWRFWAADLVNDDWRHALPERHPYLPHFAVTECRRARPLEGRHPRVQYARWVGRSGCGCEDRRQYRVADLR
jgi:hypothetical protein